MVMGSPTNSPGRLVVGITSASGAAFGLAALRQLRRAGIETHLVVSKTAAITLQLEEGLAPGDLTGLADVTYAAADVGARIASGSFRTDGMLIAPCSIRTLSEIATGVTGTLMSRAADVVLKERRRLVLMVRETPLHLGHLRSMVAVTEMGGIIMPPVPALYDHPASVAEMVEHTVGRALDLFGLDTGLRRWDGIARDRGRTGG